MRRVCELVLIVGFLCLCSLLAQAQAAPPAGVDILFLVDQSGSMGGNPDHPIPNDPNQLRFYAPIHAMRWLGSDRLQVHGNSTYRLGVLHFGDRVEEGMDWQTIAPQDTAEWQTQKLALEEALAFDDLRTRDLAGTDILKAVQRARAMFERLRPDPAGPHRKALIILTDGEPSVPNQTPDQHMQQVLSYVESNFPRDEFVVFVVAMNDVNSDYWKRMEPYWEQITEGRAVKVVSNETDVGAAFRDILRQLTADLPKPFSTEISDISLAIPTELVVPPYLQSIAFTLDKADSQKDKITIEVLEGDAIGFGTPQVQIEGEDEPIETITIYDPPPGRWRIAGTEGTTLKEVDMRQIRANGVLLSPVGMLPPNTSAQVIYQVQTSQGQPLPTYSNPRYALQVHAEIVSGDNDWPLALAYDPAQNAYVTSFTPPQLGYYLVRLSGKSQDITGQEITVFPESEVGGFEVGGLTVERLGVWPEVQPLFQPRSLAFAVSYGWSTPVQGEATFRSAGQVWTIPLTRLENGSLQGEFIPVAVGDYEGTLSLFTAMSVGEQTEIYQEDLPAFSAAAPGTQLQPGTLTQYCAGDLTISVGDGMGGALAVPAGYSLSADAILADGTRALLTTVDGASYTGRIAPTQAGAQTVEISLSTQDPSGQEWKTYQGVAGTVEVKPSTGLYVEIVEPATGARLQGRAFPLETVPLTLTLQLKDEAGRPVDDAAVLSGEPFRISFLDKQEQTVPVTVTLVPVDDGRFEGHVEGLGVGDYTLVVDVVGKPPCGYHVMPPTQSTQLFRRVEAPHVIVGLVAGPLLVIGLLAAIVALVRAGRRRRAHPCRGRIVIIDGETGEYVWSYGFPTDRHRRNRFVFKGRDLRGKAQAHFTRMEFACNTEEESNKGIVYARLFNLEGEEVLDSELRPSKGGRSTRKKVLKKKLWVYKDPIDV